MNVDGYPVLDETGQQITFQEEDQDVEIRENGLIIVDGEERNVLGVKEFANPQKLDRGANGLLSSRENPKNSETARVLQGTLEESNVSSVNELVHLTELSRGAGDTAKYIEVMYDLQRKTGSTWAKQA